MKTKVFNILKMLILAVAGLLFLLYPSKSIKIVVQLLGVALIILGLVIAISYLVKKEKEQKDLVSMIVGTVMVLLGVVDILIRDTVADIFPIVAGVLVILGGITGIVLALKDKQKGGNWLYLMAVAAASLILGIIMFIRGFDEEAILRVLGTALLYLGAVGLVNYLNDKEKEKEPEKEV